MTTLAPFDVAAIEMLKASGIKPTTEDVMILSDDLSAIGDDEFPDQNDEDVALECVGILRQRIGGFAVLPSYMASLRAGRKRA